MDPPNIGAAVYHMTVTKPDNAHYDTEAAIYNQKDTKANITKYNRSTLEPEAKDLTARELTQDRKLLNCRYLNSPNN